METDAGNIYTRSLPEYVPCFCKECGCRVGWHDEEFGDFVGLCDECAAIISQERRNQE